ncbi:MAG: 3-phosphoshikimate 1-carboxyvinyltransferase [Ruminococcus sp.]|nr:3-phosphoshikimate 1-carboxyvinyltransferase [Ruminococcus sp.]
MDIRICPGRLSGKVTAPPSKSVAHRMVIAAALAPGRSEIEGLAPSDDIKATMNAMAALGADIKYDQDRCRAVIEGIKTIPDSAVIDCCESGSTLRFLIPVAAALGTTATFLGRGKLPQRPITPYLQEFPAHGVSFDYNYTMPFTVKGRLRGGKFRIGGDISSQFITGLLFALPMLEEDSEIVLTSRLESRPYVDITVGVLRESGCIIEETENGYMVGGRQVFWPKNGKVEGDHSQGAFFEVANAIGSEVKIEGLNVNSFQGDKKVIEICKEMVYNKDGLLKPFTADVSDIPDLVPVLAVLACYCNGVSRLTNAARLRLKESDRLAAMEEDLNKLGGRVTSDKDSLTIDGRGGLAGGAEVSAFGDHRIAMAMAIAATGCEKPVTVLGAECVAKSYPDFWEVFSSLGGRAEKV